MNTHADKTQENKNRSMTVNDSKKLNITDSNAQFTDNRAETAMQRNVQAMANNGSHTSQAVQLQTIASSYSNNTIQTKSIEEEELLQGKFNTIQKQSMEEEELLQGKFETIQKKRNETGLPDDLKSGIENQSGLSIDDVKVHYNSDKPAQLNAHAYAQGTDIHMAPGQEKHLAHEAWHVVQQKQGRVKPTMQMKGNVNVNDDEGLEKEADVMGAKALQRKVIINSHDYGDGKGEPEIRTSENFDTNHLVDGPVTHDEAIARRNSRNTPRNTIINSAALIREVTANDRDLIDRSNSNVVTTYPFASPAEAMQSTPGSAAYSATVSLNSRKVAPNIVEIHHLHESQMAIHKDDFPALGSKKK
jgi:hypothetical protein